MQFPHGFPRSVDQLCPGAGVEVALVRIEGDMEIEVGPHRLCDALVFLVRQLIAFLALLVLILADVGVEHFGLIEYETSAGGEQDAQYGQGNRFLAQALQGGTDAHGQRIFGPPQVERIREEAE